MVQGTALRQTTEIHNWSTPNNHGIVFHPSYNGTTNQTMFAANDGGVYKTDNAKQAMLVTPAA